MSLYPNQFDDDASIPRVDGNITQIGGQAINALRAAVFSIEETLGINPQGTAGSLSAFLSVAHNADGSIRPSVLTSLGLVTLPITDSQISPTAGIQETKLALAFSTSQLWSFIQQNALSALQATNFIINHGSKIEPHIQGVNFNHFMPAILVSPTSSGYFVNDLGINRNNTSLYAVFGDLNDDYIKHQLSNSLPFTVSNGLASGGTPPPTNFAHNSSGIYLDTSNFSFIPQTSDNLQSFAEFIDSSNILLLGSRIQTLYQNGIPRTASSSSLLSQTQGQLIVPFTSATTFLLDGYYTTPVDDINHGDDVVMFNPANDSADGYYFDALFAAVRVGDILTVNYGSFSTSNIIAEIKYLVSQDQSSQTFAVRIDGKNLQNSSLVVASITRSLFNNNKFGVLALAQANHNIANVLPTLICGVPQGAEALSVNFNAGLIDSLHYNLYLVVYPNGNPINGSFNIPVIDISGNQGATPGVYTIDSVVLNINNKLRQTGHNNRLMAFAYQGQLGIKLTDAINNISFSIIDGALNPSTGLYNQSLSNTLFPNNAIGVPGFDIIDPTGLGPSGSGVSGPQFSTSFSSSFAAQTPAKIITAGTRKTFYVNGAEGERFALQPFMLLDGYGDSYWPGTIITKSIIPGVRVEITYQVPLNLSTSSLQIGKTITAIGTSSNTSFVDSGRFFISNILFNDCNGCNTDTPASIVSTNITVYDAIQAPNGVSPFASAPVGATFNLYFSGDSIGFNAENISDNSTIAPFKRAMEVYVNSQGNTFGHERARMYIGSAVVPSGVFGYSFTGAAIGNPLSLTPLYGDGYNFLTHLNIVGVSPKLRGFAYNGVDKINLQLTSYNSITGAFSGYLCNFNAAGNVITSQGPITTGKKGKTARFFDQTNVEYIDVLFDISDNGIPSFPAAIVNIDIQLFPTLQLDQDVMLLGSVQINNQSSIISYLTDLRQFGNVSEVQLSTSAIGFIGETAQYIAQNGVVRGFDLVSTSPLTLTNAISFNGGLALTDGAFNSFNPFVVSIPLVQDNNGGSPVAGVLWAICANAVGEIQLIPLTDANNTVNNINSPGRLLQLFNPVNNTAYFVDSTTFSALINTRKDLTILYLVNAQVNSISSYTLTVSDARKYVNDATANNYMVFSSDKESTNFKSFAAINNWAQYNTASPAPHIILRGAFSITSNPNLAAANYVGDGCQITISAFVPLVSNTSFTNCNFTITSAKGFVIPSVASNISFKNCAFTYAPSSGFTSGNLINSGNGAIYCAAFAIQNISIEGCTFTTATSARPPFISFEYGSTASIAQSISIRDNKFFNTSSADDFQAVIAITCLVISSPVLEGMKLIDCLIENNLCDKSQLIAITGTRSSAFVINALTPISVSILNNTCGAIGVMGVSDDPRNYNIQINGFVYDKNPGFLVSGNNCHFIGFLEATGQFVDGSVFGFTAASAPIIVEKNNVSWINLSANNPTATLLPNQYKGSNISILDNNLRAFNPAFLTNYSSSLQAQNVGIYLVELNESATPPRAMVRGNTVLTGLNSTSAPAAIQYDYQSAAVYEGPNIFASCLLSRGMDISIESNVFDGNFNVLVDIIAVLSSVPILVSNNRFYRNGSTVRSYINTQASGFITENFFDSTTIDGTSFVQVINQGHAIVSQNKNQVGFAFLNPNLLSWGSTSPNTGAFTTALNASGWSMTFTAATDGLGTVSAVGTLDGIVPNGTQILNVVMGIEGGTVHTDTFKITLFQGHSTNIPASFFDTSSPPTSFANSATDQAGTNFGANTGFISNIATAVASASAYCYIPSSGGSLSTVYIGQGNTTQILFNVIGMSNSGDHVELGPILIKYQW